MTAGTNEQATDAVRQRVHDGWAAVAPAWAEHSEYTDARGAVVTERMLELAALEAGDRVLELACGAGGLGLAASRLVGSTGVVVLSDVVPEMTAIAAARAEALGLTNITTSVLDLEEIDEPDASYDAVVCREGLMFATEPQRATAEICRVLVPGGRVVLAVWGPRASNPWLGLVFDAVSVQLGMPIPPPGIPGPFALDDAGRLSEILSSAFTDVVVESVSAPMRAASFDEWWMRTSSLAGPLTAILASLPDDAKRELIGRLRDAVAPYEGDAGIDLPGVSLVAAARRPPA